MEVVISSTEVAKQDTLASTHSDILTRTHAHTHTRTHSRTHAKTHARIHAHMHTRARAHSEQNNRYQRAFTHARTHARTKYNSAPPPIKRGAQQRPLAPAVAAFPAPVLQPLLVQDGLVLAQGEKLRLLAPAVPIGVPVCWLAFSGVLLPLCVFAVGGVLADVFGFSFSVRVCVCVCARVCV